MAEQKAKSESYPAPLPDSGSRLGSAEDARQACEKLLEDNLEGVRGKKLQQWLGMFQGTPPFSPRDQMNRNRRWQTNVSTRIAESLLEGASTPYYNLFEGGPSMAVVKLKNKNKEEADRKSRIATKHFNHALKQLRISDPFYRTARSFVGFGIGFWWWPGPIDWKPRCKAFHEVLFPKGAPTDTEELDFFAVRVKMNPADLYKHYRDGNLGWNKEEIMRVLKRAANISPNSPNAQREYIAYQQELHSHDLTISEHGSTVDLIYVYGREFDGKWTLGVVDRHAIKKDSRGQSDERDWVFFRKSYAELIEELIVPFIYDPGDGSMKGVEGLASEIYSMVMLFDRMFCKIADGGFIRSLMALTSRNNSGRIDGTITVRGGVIHLPQGAEAVNSQAFADLNGPVTVARLILELIGKVSGVYLPSSERPVGNPDTAQEARLKYAQRTQLTVSGITRFYGALDTAYETVYNRLLKNLGNSQRASHHGKIADEFLQNCEDEGLTMKELKDYRIVKAYRVSGGGSNAEQQAALGQLAGIAGAMPSTGRRHFFNEITAATAGPDKVSEFWPVDIDEPGEAQWEASVENNQALAGTKPLLTGGQIHEDHLTVHIQALAEGISSVEQGADPASVLAFGAIMLPHSQATLERLAEDKTASGKVKAFKQQLGLLQQNYAKLPQLVKQQREAQQDQARAQAIQQGMDPKLQLQAAEKQARSQMKAAQAAADQRRSEESHQQEMRQKAEQFQLDQAIKAREAQETE